MGRCAIEWNSIGGRLLDDVGMADAVGTPAGDMSGVSSVVLRKDQSVSIVQTAAVQSEDVANVAKRTKGLVKQDHALSHHKLKAVKA